MSYQKKNEKKSDENFKGFRLFFAMKKVKKSANKKQNSFNTDFMI